MKLEDLINCIISLTPDGFAKKIDEERRKAADLLSVEACIHLVVYGWEKKKHE